jgi:hypothetical protein
MMILVIKAEHQATLCCEAYQEDLPVQFSTGTGESPQSHLYSYQLQTPKILH